MTRGVVAWCLLGAAALSGCGESFRSEPIDATTVDGKIRTRRAGGEEIRVWRDPETGCQYLLWERRQRGGITPRLKADGRPVCG